MNEKQFRYIKISDTSGCIAETYKVKDADSEVVILVEQRDVSGRYKPYKHM